MRRLVCAVLLTTLILANLACAATKYLIKDLGVLPGDDNSSAWAMNSKGQVIGKSHSSADCQDMTLNSSRTFLWQDGKMTEVKSPSRNHKVLFLDINDAGQIVGMSLDKKGNSHAVMWAPVK